MEITPRVHSISMNESAFMGVYAPNIYLISGKEAALIDSGYSSEDIARNVLQHISEINSLKLAYIIITHPHPDHIGGCRPIREATGAKVILHPLAAAEAEKNLVTADVLVEDDDKIDIGGVELQVIHTPGHTSGHICLYYRDEGVLFAGDHILGIGTTVIDSSDGDMAHYISSLKKLLICQSRLICPGHGPVIREPERKIRELIAHRQEREEQLLFYLRQRERTLGELVGEIYPELDRRLVNMAEMQLMAHLRKLINEEKVIFSGKDYALK